MLPNACHVIRSGWARTPTHSQKRRWRPKRTRVFTPCGSSSRQTCVRLNNILLTSGTELGTFCTQTPSLQANGSTPAQASSAAAAASGRTTLRRCAMQRCARRWPSHKSMKRRTAGSRHKRPATRLLWKRKHVVAQPTCCNVIFVGTDKSEL